MIRTSIEHNTRVNLIGALCLSPAQRRIQLRVRSDRHSINGDRVIQFLRHLLAVRPGPLVLLWDRHPMYCQRKVQEFLVEHRRLHTYSFPTAAPELNPAEFVWTQVSESTASSAPRNRAELQANVFAGVARTRRSPRRLWACVHTCDLPWKGKKDGHCLVKTQ